VNAWVCKTPVFPTVMTFSFYRASLLPWIGAIALFVSAAEAEASTTLTDNLVLYLDFESDALGDSSGVGTKVANNGVTSNTLTGHYGEVVGISGKAGFFNRSQGDYAKLALSYGSAVAPAGGSSLGYSFTISSWYYLQPQDPNPTGDKRFFVYESDENFELSFYIRGYQNGQPPAAFNTEGVTSTNGPVTGIGSSTRYDLATHEGSWNHILETFDSDGTSITKKTYLNGVLKNTATRAISAFQNSSAINLGTYRDNNNRYWDGFLDEVGVWNRALTANEVTELYEMNRSGLSLVPEPSRAALLFVGVGWVWSRRRR
jgi:hypothetical protein